MPEGDTIARAARSLDTWLKGRVVTKARSRTLKAPLARIVGTTILAVEAQAKHLLVRFDNGDVLHTHMRMTGSWHVYSASDRWRKPGWQAAVVLEAGDHVAVCFNAPVVELLSGERAEREHPSLAGLGPDVLKPPIDLGEVRRRATATVASDLSVGELLLDQRVVSGIGNIYRCESLFVERRDPWQPWTALSHDELDALVLTAARLMQANVELGSSSGRDFGGGPGHPRVYGRPGRPCVRCRGPIAFTEMGEPPRQIYWCPTCQAPNEPG